MLFHNVYIFQWLLFIWEGAVIKQNVWLISRHKKVNKIPFTAAEKFISNLSWTTKIQTSCPIHEHLNANFLLFSQQEQSALNTRLFIMERLNAKEALAVIAHRILRIKKCKNQSHSSSMNLPKSHYYSYVCSRILYNLKFYSVNTIMYLCIHIEVKRKETYSK